ncbi:patatin-like phospholipase family protein [Allorhodopirellula heiligendammensis]|uniref:Patatin-like phospholipase n=1 Tax=Allorhodopirellula heiligendammensis TaxID=2714739 RepID=A0A5C6C6M0_9BACT|nr:patatin-like phospholipase family protein [Allorhodopirellula heiligendammensis]TWU19755.1 Patatin-like phospholipase [Allorhodopirellula heiligendammensis]
MKIALAFSGGGVRATVFHLGVLARLARQDLLGNVKIVSSVSGGSLAAGLVFASSGYQWPGSAEYLHEVVPRVLSLLTTRNLQRSFALQSLLLPWRLVAGRAAVLGDAIERQWGIEGALADLPESPHWIINATCYQTGKNWRFQRDLMGDYQTKYITQPDFRLSHALAASAAVPGLIGPLVVRSQRYRWSEYRADQWQPIAPRYKRLHLWDGGVYDNLGVESLFKPGEGLREGTDFLIVCDASRPLSSDSRQSRWSPAYLRASLRLVDVATDQVRSLRTRMLIQHFKQNPGSGAYLRLGLATKKVYARNQLDGKPALTDDEVKRVATIETTLRRLTHSEFSMLFRHGYEVADATLSTYGSEVIKTVPHRRVLFKAA